jgi:hypothetical protein
MTLHTTGTMTFKESEYEPNRFTIGVDGNWLMGIQHNGEQTVLRQRENMRRLAACWNACYGIPTEVLEANQSGGLPWSVADQIDARVLQAEMLEALQGVLRVADRKTIEFDAARAAIAKATRSPT